jgi:hypothetical protein
LLPVGRKKARKSETKKFHPVGRKEKKEKKKERKNEFGAAGVCVNFYHSKT